MFISCSKAIEILEAYEGTLEDDYPPDNERYEHGEMLLYKVSYTVLSIFLSYLYRIYGLLFCLNKSFDPLILQEKFVHGAPSFTKRICTLEEVKSKNV